MPPLDFVIRDTVARAVDTCRTLITGPTATQVRYRNMHREQRALEKSLSVQCREDFIKAAGITPRTFLKMTMQGLPHPHKSDIRYEDEGTPFFTVVYEGLGYKGNYAINFAEKAFEAGTVQNTGSRRGVGRKMFAQHIVSALYLGFSRVTGTASLELGAHTWARAGAYIEPQDILRVSSILQRRLAAIADFLDPEMYSKVSEHVLLRKRTDLRKIAELDKILPNIAAIWEHVHTHEMGMPTPYSFYRERKVVKDNDMTLSQFLLLGLSYEVYFNLRDPAQMKRLEDFTGVPMRERAAINHEKYPRVAVRPSKPWLVMR